MKTKHKNKISDPLTFNPNRTIIAKNNKMDKVTGTCGKEPNSPAA